jgi:hypothetical protein
MGKELDLLVIFAAVESLHEEHGLDRIQGHGNDLARLDRIDLDFAVNRGRVLAKECLKIICRGGCQIAPEKFPIA